MNIKHYLSLVLILSIIVCMVPFSSVKAADNLTNGYVVDSNDSSIRYGRFDEYELYENGSAINAQIFGLAFDASFRVAYIIDIELNNSYNGRIELTGSGLTGLTTNSFWYIDGEGAAIYSTTGNIVYVDIYNCSSFRVYYLRTDTNLTQVITDIKLSGTVSSDIVPGYNLPWYQLTAFALVSQNPNQVIYDDGDISPHINITSGSRSRTVSVPTRETRHFIFISSVNLTAQSSQSIGSITSSNSYVSCTFSSISPYTFSGGYRMYDLTFTNGHTSSQNFYMNYNTTFEMIPIFYGSYSQMPDDVYAVVNGTHVYDNQLSRILQALLSNAGDNGQTSQDISDVTNDLTDVTDDIDAIEADIDDLFDTHITNIDLDDYDIFDDMTTTNLFFKTYLDDVFTNLGDFKAIIIVPVIVTVMMIMIGWVF